MRTDFETLKVNLENETLWVTLNRPERLNALSRTLVEELRGIFVDLYWRHDIRTVVLQGAGNNFCAGLDLKETSGSNSEDGSAPRRGPGAGLVAQRKISEIVIAMRRCPQPIISLWNGSAAGGGFAIMLASDVRIATPTARGNAAFIKIGLSACDIGVSYFLPRLVGASVASELMLTGRFINAERSASLGLVSKIVAADQLETEARQLLSEMHATTPLGLRLTKECLNFSIDAAGLEAAIAMEDRNQILASAGEDFGEGVRAFLEKRPPVYGPAKAGG
jgi:enoyl-CoA hydratase/carnithine racemase